MSLGFVHGFGTISLADIPLDENQGSWFVSVDILLTIMFAPFGGKMAEIMGIKKTALLCSPLIVIGWVLVGVFSSPLALFLGRILSGIGVSIMMVSSSVYIAETVHPEHRTKLASSIGLSFSLGMCILWLLGYFFRWQTIAILSTIPSIVTFIGFLYLPDTPYWLIQKKRYDDALESLHYFRKHFDQDEIKTEFSEMFEQYQHKKKATNPFSWICSPAFYKPFLCVGLLVPFYECTGNYVVISYMQFILAQTKIELELRTCSVIVALVRIISSVITMTTIHKLPLKLTYVIFATLKTISLGLIGLFFLIEDHNSEMTTTLTWLPFTMIIIFYICNTWLTAINWILIGELFPADIRNFASGLIESLSYITTFIILKFFLDMKYELQLFGVFFSYASFGILLILHGALTIPDTKGKSLTEIEENYDS